MYEDILIEVARTIRELEAELVARIQALNTYKPQENSND